MERPERSCEVCGQSDDHPRHVQGSTVRHMDCCAAEGCVICQATEQEYGGLRGQELIDHLDKVRG